MTQTEIKKKYAESKRQKAKYCRELLKGHKNTWLREVLKITHLDIYHKGIVVNIKSNAFDILSAKFENER